MTDSIVQVLIYLSANPGQAAELKRILLEVVQNRCQEIACRKCNVLQSSTNLEEFILVEEWRLQERLESKLSADYLHQFFLEANNLLAKVPSLQWFYVVQS